MDYETASEEGWIATINGRSINSLFCVRLNIATTTKIALTVLYEIFKAQSYSLIVDDIHANKNLYGLGPTRTRREDLAFLRSLIKSKT